MENTDTETPFQLAVEGLWEGAPELEGANAQEIMIQVENGVSVRVIVWEPKNSKERGPGPVVMVPGWASLFEGWRPLVSEWVKTRKLIYIETREKASAVITRRVSKSDFSIERHCDDVSNVLEELGVDQSKVDWFASSLGSTLLIDAYQRGTLDGRSSVLLAPNPDFEFPLWAKMIILTPMPMFVYRAMIGFVAWVVDRRTKEEGQKIRYRRTLLNQDVKRMLLSTRSNIGYSLPADLSSVNVPCAVMTAHSDTIHDFGKVKGIVDAIPGCRLIEVPSNQYAHEADVLKEIDEFHSSLS